ncbi:MAG: flagellar biosynthetic protein FliO [Mailhella sp.]|nr:flagellar biosynthetic protein FliO [Mailhella sp.]
MKSICTFFLSFCLIFTICLSAQNSFATPDPVQNNAAMEEQSKKTNTVQEQKTAPSQIQKQESFAATEEIPSTTWGNYFQGLGIMLLLLFAFWYILKLMRKYGNGRFLPNQKLLPRDSMYLEGQIPLGQGKSVVIINVLDERLILGVTEKNINLLSKTGINHAETFEELMRKTAYKDNTDA